MIFKFWVSADENLSTGIYYLNLMYILGNVDRYDFIWGSGNR